MRKIRKKPQWLRRAYLARRMDEKRNVFDGRYENRVVCFYAGLTKGRNGKKNCAVRATFLNEDKISFTISSVL